MPGNITSIPKIAEPALIIALPAAPLPPPPLKEIVGGPQNKGPTLQLLSGLLAMFFRPSTAPLI